MKATRLIFCGFLLAAAGCEETNSNKTTAPEPAKKSAATAEVAPPAKNSQSVPAELAVEKSEPAPIEEPKVNTPAESVEEKSEPIPIDEPKIDAPAESVEEKSESTPVEEPKVDVPTDESKAVENQDVSAGKKLHDDNCVSCHATRIKDANPNTLYTRESRKVSNLNKLQGQVERCVTVLNVEWFDDEIDSVVNYLNTDFYKFEPKADK